MTSLITGSNSISPSFNASESIKYLYNSEFIYNDFALKINENYLEFKLSWSIN